MNYKNAFNCKKCPQCNSEQGCPNWVEFIQTDMLTGNEKVTKMCGYQAMPIFLVEVIKASNRPAAEIGAMRGEIDASMSNIVNGMRQVPQMLATIMMQHPQLSVSND